MIKYSKLHKSREKGEGARDERKSSSASVFEVANANGPNDLTRGKCEFLYPVICRQKERCWFLSWTGPLHSCKMPSCQTLNEPPWFHLEIPDDILKAFRAVISLFCFEILLVFSSRSSVSGCFKGCRQWDSQFKDTFYSKTESKKRRNKLSLPALLSLFFNSLSPPLCLPAKQSTVADWGLW